MAFSQQWETTVGRWMQKRDFGKDDLAENKYFELAKKIQQIEKLSSSSSYFQSSTEHPKTSASRDNKHIHIQKNSGNDFPINCYINQEQYTGVRVVPRYTFGYHSELDNIEKEMAKELFLSKPPPPERYVCDICNTKGHYKNMCPEILNQDRGCTPYQGVKQCVGEFICSKCKRKWMSYHSWANYAQNCVKCKISVYPKKQRPLIPATERVKKHPQHLCQKCKDSGSKCGATCNQMKKNMTKHNKPKSVVDQQQGTKTVENYSMREKYNERVKGTVIHYPSATGKDKQLTKIIQIDNKTHEAEDQVFCGNKITNLVQQFSFNDSKMNSYEGFFNIDYFKTIINL